MLVLLLSFALIGAFLIKIAAADGDFTLLSKGHVKGEGFKGKVVWITGASKGIGKVLANQFASLGAKLILSSRNASELEQVKTELAEKYPSCKVEILCLDLSSGEELLAKAVHKAESFHSNQGVDYMVHNAAYDPHLMSALEITEESLLKTFKTNVFGTISLTKLLVPYMLKRGRGHFIVISSAAGKCPAPGQAGYAASKFALNGYFHTLRSELCKKGIKITVVCPGPVDTSKGNGHHDDSEKRVPVERCVELIIRAASHGLKEIWIAKQPVLLAMYLVQYMPTIGFWVLDKVGVDRVKDAERNIKVSEQKKAT